MKIGNQLQMGTHSRVRKRQFTDTTMSQTTIAPAEIDNLQSRQLAHRSTQLDIAVFQREMLKLSQ